MPSCHYAGDQTLFDSLEHRQFASLITNYVFFFFFFTFSGSASFPPGIQHSRKRRGPPPTRGARQTMAY
jgi:hypothetical protein